MTSFPKWPLQPSDNTVTFPFIFIPGSKLSLGFPFLSRPISPVWIPETSPFSLKINLLAANPGKISTPKFSANSPSHLHKLDRLII